MHTLPRPMLGLSGILLLTWMSKYGYSASSDICQSPQYLKLRERGVINCNFPDVYYGIYWYDRTNVTSNDNPELVFTEGVKSGPGYTSREYDIYENGSLIINEVSIEHNHFFGATLLESLDQDPSFYDVRVVPFDEPLDPYPTINVTGCKPEKICFLKLNTSSKLNCKVLRVGEVLDDLSWTLRTRDGDKKISFRSIDATTGDNELYSYYVDVNVPLHTSPALSLFVCASRSNVPEVGSSESVILVDHGTSQPSSEPLPTPLSVSPNEKVIMDCGSSDVLSLVWKKVNESEEIIAFSVANTSEKWMNKEYSDGFTLESNNSLIISIAEDQTSGIYTCVFSYDGLNTTSMSYEVILHIDQPNIAWIGVVAALLIPSIVVLIIFIAVPVFQHKVSKAQDTYMDIAEGKELLHTHHAFKPQDSGTKKMAEKVPLKNIRKISSEELTVWCSKDVIISGKDSQEICTKQLEMLKKASETKITIKRVILEDSFKSVEEDGTAIHLSSGETLPPLEMVKRLDFTNKEWHKLESTNFTSIMLYCSHSTSLEEIKFTQFVLPFDCQDCLKILKTKLYVQWETGVGSAGILKLNDNTGKWENIQGGLISVAYNDIVAKAKVEKAKEKNAEEPTEKNAVELKEKNTEELKVEMAKDNNAEEPKEKNAEEPTVTSVLSSEQPCSTSTTEMPHEKTQPSGVDSVVGDDVIQDLSGKIGKEWKALGKTLLLQKADFENIKKERKDDHKDEVFNMLLTWKNRNGNGATYKVLSEALRVAKRKDLQDEICKQANSKNPSSSEQPNTSTMETPQKIAQPSATGVDHGVGDDVIQVENVKEENAEELKVVMAKVEMAKEKNAEE